MNPVQNSAQELPKNVRVAAVQMVSTSRLDENLATASRLIADAVAQGASLLAGGQVSGNVMAPAVLANVMPAMQCYAEESFGPLAALYKAEDFEQAIALANDTSYGLSSGIITNDMQKAFDFALRMNAGAVHINDNSFEDDPNAPFGGTKDSGHGRENGRYSVHDMTELKWITLQLGQSRYPI